MLAAQRKEQMTELAQGHRPGGPVPLTAVFIACLKISLYGTGGGGLVWARRIAVEHQAWVSEQEFAEIVSLCQLLPGPNIVGIATCVGTKLRGVIGAVAAVAGFLLIPWTIGFTCGVLFLDHAHHPVFQRILHGISPVAAGLLIATGVRMLLPHRTRPIAIFFAASAVILVAFAKLPVLVTLLGVAPISIGVAGLQRGIGQ